MFAITGKIDAVSMDKGLLVLCMVVGWTIVLAQGADRLELPPQHDELLREEVFEGADDWRESPQVENQWRAPPKKQDSRIKYGYDPSYEEMRAGQNEFSDPEPSSLFRLQF